MTLNTNALLRSLPAVSVLLEHEEVLGWLSGLPRSTVVESLQAAIAQTRDAIVAGNIKKKVDLQELLGLAEIELARQSMPSLRRVINATGIVLHTGLGRAPLCDVAIEAIAECCSGYCNLEYDLGKGSRGHRESHVNGQLASLTGAEAATVVNNNAAATLLILQAMASGRETIVSRGQLIEIGGSFRLPDIMRASGSALCEVGTTNRTRIGDYEKAINDQTAVLMRVHTSNYRVVGFTEEASIDSIASLAHKYGLIAVDDLGSGALIDFKAHKLPEEPSIQRSLEAGADLVCFSGDKLLGGPQCGVIVGRRDLVEQIESNPLMRTYRLDKLTLLALEATLHCYKDLDDAINSIPALAMMTSSTEELAERARVLCEQLEAALPDERFLVCSDVSYMGGGSMPQEELETVAVQWQPAQESVDTMMQALRDAEVPVVARVRDDAIFFDLRTIRDGDLEPLVSSVASAVWNPECGPDVDVDTNREA